MNFFPRQLQDWLKRSPYQGYAYAYPHKSAYRPLSHPRPLREVWGDARRDALFLYLHVPFCEMRCGFCNLFTTANPQADFAAQYLEALQRQARRVRAHLEDARFANMAIGGGTPTFLDLKGLETLFDLAAGLFNIDLAATPISCETSPRTAVPEKLRLLRDRGVTRLSMGVQSFIEAETRAVGRAQKPEWVQAALEAIRAVGFPTVNLDLIYGLPEQTVETWLHSLRMALRYCPEEIYLYPLYHRPLTGLDRIGVQWHDIRPDCYRAGRDFLRSEGYEQVSLRMFRKRESTKEHEGARRGTKLGSSLTYCCQEDGMVGLGCGARSYTRSLHYSSEYAVSRMGVRGILADYIEKPEEAFDVADYGFELDADEQRRRYVLMSLLQAEGLDLMAYRRRFGSSALEDLPELKELQAQDLAELLTDPDASSPLPSRFRLNAAGLERSDTIGPWLASQRVQALMQEYELR